MYQIVKKPLVTEKNSMQSAFGVYAFEVDKKATKLDVKKAVEKLFDVKVDSVRTSICRNRPRRMGMTYSKVRYWKKAMVRLKEGEKIALFEGA